MEIRLATADDIEYVCSRLKPADANEINLSQGINQDDEKEFCKKNECLVGILDINPVCLFGCEPIGGSFIPWLISTVDISDNATWFLRQSKKILAIWLKEFGNLTTYVHVEHKKSIAWLEWLGFERKIKIEINGLPYYLYERCK